MADSVSEHAFALASALKRRILPMHQLTVEGKKWAEVRAPHLAFGQPPRTNAEETLVSAALPTM
jgi:phosphoglycerate dehydrogenase-like enzyme